MFIFHLKKIDVVFHILSSLVKIKLLAKNNLPQLPRTALAVMIPGVVVVQWCGFLTDYKTTPG
jgi:hypothetical protein